MSNYQPITNPGETRRRVRFFSGTNPLGKLPYMQFQEESVVRLADGSEVGLGDSRSIIIEYQPGKVIESRDPITDEVTGTTTHDAVFAAIYSLARSGQVEADQAAEPQALPNTNDPETPGAVP